MVKKQGHLDAEIIKYHLLSNSKLVSPHVFLESRIAIARDCAGRAEEIGERVLAKWEASGEWLAKLALIYAYKAKKMERKKLLEYCASLPIDNSMVAKAMFEACYEVKLPLKYAKQVLRRDVRDERREAAFVAAIRWCERVDIPRRRIMRLAGENGNLVMEYFVHRKSSRLPVAERADGPIKRVIEPPELVYKKCLNDVIVVATIPSYACVFHGTQGGFRANGAKIVEVIGDFLGDEVGISLYDLKTQYRAGDKVFIENFDYSDLRSTTGFHFFCTKEEAEWFDL